MAKLKEGDRVRIASRTVTEEDRKTNRYFGHMAGLTGEVQNVYEDGIAVNVELDSLGEAAARVHKDATDRMRARFAADTSEEAKKQLSKEEMEFVPHYVLLVREQDLEKI